MSRRPSSWSSIKLVANVQERIRENDSNTIERKICWKDWKESLFNGVHEVRMREVYSQIISSKPSMSSNLLTKYTHVWTSLYKLLEDEPEILEALHAIQASEVSIATEKGEIKLLDVLLDELTRTTQTLTTYTSEQRKGSKLVWEVIACMGACYGALTGALTGIVDDLAQEVKKRLDNLQSSIARETLRTCCSTKELTKELLSTAQTSQMDTLYPGEYYSMGKGYLGLGDYINAQRSFLAYRRFVENKCKVRENDVDMRGIHAPKEDNSLKYLMMIQDKLNEHAQERCSMLSIAPNPYREAWARWQKNYIS